MKVALISLDQEWEDKQANLEHCRALASRAATMGAEFLVFPEMTLTGFTMHSTQVAEAGSDSPTIRAFADLSRQLGVHVAFGVVLTGQEKPRNCLVVVDPAGVEVASYAKIHPFSHVGEDDHFEGGDCLVAVAVGDLRVGLTVCYDLRFPELYTALAPGCDAILVIANWPGSRIGHWHALLRARAIDGQCFVIAVNRTGTDRNDIEYPASSQVLDPRGERMNAVLADGCIALYDVCRGTVEDYRQAFPTLRDRRPSLYVRFSSAPGPAGPDSTTEDWA
jgi:omega-amidase